MKEEHAVLPIITGIALSLIASHIMPWEHPAADTAELTLLIASVASILGGIYAFCAMTAKHSKSIAKQMLELEEVTD